MGNLTSRTGNFSSNAARRPSSSTVDSDWEGECGHGQSVGAPSSISASSTDQNITQGTDGQRTPGPFELPHCDDELTNWLNVMPARVVDKLFEYLQTLSERGQRESLQCKLRQANFTPYEGIQHAFPNLNNRHRSGNSNTHEDPQLRMATRTNSSNLSHAFEPLSPQSPTETHTPVNIGYQNNMSLLQQLRDSHASASRTMSILETTIRKVDSQLASQRLVRPHANAIGRLPLPLTTTTMPTTGSFPPSTTRNPLSTLTPPPENRSSYSMTLEQLEKMFAPSAHREIGASNLEYRVPKSQLGDGAVAKMESVADCGLAPNRAHGHAAAKEEDFQEAFDSLIDFGGGDAFFQNFDLGTA